MSDRSLGAGLALIFALATSCSAPPCACTQTTPSSAEVGPAPSQEPAPPAEAQATIAERLNKDGEAELAAQRLVEAAAAFRDAAARVPEPLYFYNLARALEAQGKYSEAYTACNAATNASAPGSKLHAQADALAAKLLHEASQLE